MCVMLHVDWCSPFFTSIPIGRDGVAVAVGLDGGLLDAGGLHVVDAEGVALSGAAGGGRGAQLGREG